MKKCANGRENSANVRENPVKNVKTKNIDFIVLGAVPFVWLNSHVLSISHLSLYICMFFQDQSSVLG